MVNIVQRLIADGKFFRYDAVGIVHFCFVISFYFIIILLFFFKKRKTRITGIQKVENNNYFPSIRVATRCRVASLRGARVRVAGERGDVCLS